MDRLIKGSYVIKRLYLGCSSVWMIFYYSLMLNFYKKSHVVSCTSTQQKLTKKLKFHLHDELKMSLMKQESVAF